MKNQTLASMFATAPLETKVLVSMVEALLGDKKVEDVIDGLNAGAAEPEVRIAGRPLRYWSGMTEEQLDAAGLSAEDKEVFYSYFEKPSKKKASEVESEAKEVEADVEAPEAEAKPAADEAVSNKKSNDSK